MGHRSESMRGLALRDESPGATHNRVHNGAVRAQRRRAARVFPSWGEISIVSEMTAWVKWGRGGV